MHTHEPFDPGALAVVVPVHDEAPALAGTLRAIKALPIAAELVVVDDGSSDGSAAIAEGMGVRVVGHDRVRGYGASLKTGLEATRSRYVAIVDADGSYAPGDLARLAQVLPKGGMAIGARREPSVARRWLKAMLCWQVRLLTGASVPDLNSGLRVFDRRLASRLSRVLPDRFSFTTTLTLGALALDVPVEFLPVEYRRRSAGRSKFTTLDAWRMARTVGRGCAWMRTRSVERLAALHAGARLRWTICALMLVLLLWLAPHSAWGRLFYPCALGATLYLPFSLFKVVRWRRLLASLGVALPWSEAIRAYLTGLAVGAVTPGRAGEFARVAGPRRSGHSLGPLVLATVTDRVMDLGIIASVALGAAWYWALTPSWTVLALGATLGAGLLVFAAPAVTRLALTKVLRLETEVPRLGLVNLCGALGWSVLSMSLFFVMALALMRGSEVSAPCAVLLGAIAAGNLAAIVPVSVGGMGSREGAILVSLGSAGFASGAHAIATYALAFHLVFTLTPWILLVACELARLGVHASAPGRRLVA